jgi:hypothetical protein
VASTAPLLPRSDSVVVVVGPRSGGASAQAV